MSNIKNSLKRDKLNMWIVAENVNNPPIKNLPYNDDEGEDDLQFFIGIPAPSFRAKGQMVYPFPVYAVFKNVYNDDQFLIEFTKRNMNSILEYIDKADSFFPGYKDMVEQQVNVMVNAVSRNKKVEE